MKLYLDDRRVPYDASWVHVMDYWAFRHALEDNPQGFKELSMDWDLGWARQNGMHCLHWLYDLCEYHGYPTPEKITMHSSNGECRKDMCEVAKVYFPYAQIVDQEDYS